MIRIDGLTKEFDGFRALENLTLSIPSGELFVFLGPNGAGKTTTIKMTVGLLKPTAGSVQICGCDVHADPVAAKLLLSYVPDQPYLYEKLTGREFLRFVGTMYGLSKHVIHERLSEIAGKFALEGFLDELGETYSHGMKQRVVIAAALLHEPRVLIIDEPMVGLDPRNAATLKSVLRDLTQDGVTVFMSTHTLAVAEETADRVGILRAGRLIAIGSPEEIYRQARTDDRLEDAFLRLTEEELPPRA